MEPLHLVAWSAGLSVIFLRESACDAAQRHDGKPTGIPQILHKVLGFGNRAGGIAKVSKRASEASLFYWLFQYRRNMPGSDFRATLSKWSQVEFQSNFSFVERTRNKIWVDHSHSLYDTMKITNARSCAR